MKARNLDGTVMPRFVVCLLIALLPLQRLAVPHAHAVANAPEHDASPHFHLGGHGHGSHGHAGDHRASHSHQHSHPADGDGPTAAHTHGTRPDPASSPVPADHEDQHQGNDEGIVIYVSGETGTPASQRVMPAPDDFAIDLVAGDNSPGECSATSPHRIVPASRGRAPLYLTTLALRL